MGELGVFKVGRVIGRCMCILWLLTSPYWMEEFLFAVNTENTVNINCWIRKNGEPESRTAIL